MVLFTVQLFSREGCHTTLGLGSIRLRLIFERCGVYLEMRRILSFRDIRFEPSILIVAQYAALKQRSSSSIVIIIIILLRFLSFSRLPLMLLSSDPSICTDPPSSTLFSAFVLIIHPIVDFVLFPLFRLLY